jgi:transposase InsO family protein
VHKLISDALDDLEATAAQSAKQLRRMQEERLDAMQLKLWPQRGNPRVADTLLRIEQRRAALRGLDAPTLVAPTLPDGSAMPPALDLSKLSTDQLEALEAIYQTCAIDPAPDAEPTPKA